MTATFTLLITKTAYTLNGGMLDTEERFAYKINRMNRCANPEIVRHFTVLHQKEFRTGKAAWAAATPELIDACGLVAGNGNYNTEFAEYDINVVRTDRIAEFTC
jgi:hypothetical protein